MSAPATSWTIDPDDPRAPPQGDAHFNAKATARDVLGGYFARIGRRVYLACELPIYYPGQKLLAPDVIAVLDVENYERESWVVTDEGKGIDFALEVLVSGNRRKDMENNVERYAQLGISEYFVFDRGRLRLFGHRLPAPSAHGYEHILPQGRRYASHVLGLDLRIEGTKLRFVHGLAVIPEANEVIASLERLVDEREARANAAEERAAEEARLRADAERKLAEALAEIERLKGER